MSKDLAELRRQRAELDQQIAAAESAGIDAWNGALDGLSEMLNALAEERGQEPSDSWRKNVTTLTLGRVQVELGYIEQDYGAWLAVRRGDLSIVFGAQAGVAPSPDVLRALVIALLDEETGS